MKLKIAILDDYQQAAFKFANWTAIRQKAEVTVFHDHLTGESELVSRLSPFHIICVMRERTPFSGNILKQLPNLKLIVSTGMRNASINSQAAEELGITIKPTGYNETGAPELTWALLMALARHIPKETGNIRAGQWQTTVGVDLKGKTIGIIGLGRIGSKIAHYAKAFEMKVIAWSENLTEEKAHRAGAEQVSKERLLSESDFVTIHLVLSDRSKGIIQKRDLERMKQTAFLINTSRGSLIDEAGLIEVLKQNKIAGAALDVYDTEPLPSDHPFRTLQNVLATPHIGYVTEDTYRVFYEDTVMAIEEWLKQ